jgi:hypothetical protein
LSLSKIGTHNLAALGVDFGDPSHAVAWEFSHVCRPGADIWRKVRYEAPNPDRATQNGKRIWIFPQVACIRIAALERTLLETASRLGVEVRWQTKAIGFEDFGNHTVVHSVNSEGGNACDEAWIVIIADGSGKAHQRAVTKKSLPDDQTPALIETLGLDICLDSPDLGRFIAAPFRCTSGGPGLHINADVINGLPMQRNSRFDMPQESAMVQARLPTCGRLTDSDKRGWLAWAAHEHGIEEPAMLDEPVEFNIAATRARNTVVRNPSSASGISGAKLLVGMTRASTPQTHGSGYQATGLSDAYAVGAMLRRIFSHEVSERAALAHYETGRNNAARMLARRHGYNTPIFGLRAMREEDFNRLHGQARSRGYRGDQPYLI